MNNDNLLKYAVVNPTPTDAMLGCTVQGTTTHGTRWFAGPTWKYPLALLHKGVELGPEFHAPHIDEAWIWRSFRSMSTGIIAQDTSEHDDDHLMAG